MIGKTNQFQEVCWIARLKGVPVRPVLVLNATAMLRVWETKPHGVITVIVMNLQRLLATIFFASSILITRSATG